MKTFVKVTGMWYYSIVYCKEYYLVKTADTYEKSSGNHCGGNPFKNTLRLVLKYLFDLYLHKLNTPTML